MIIKASVLIHYIHNNNARCFVQVQKVKNNLIVKAHVKFPIAVNSLKVQIKKWFVKNVIQHFVQQVVVLNIQINVLQKLILLVSVNHQRKVILD